MNVDERLVDYVEHSLGDNRVQPVDKVVVVHGPVSVALLDGRQREDIVVGAELLQQDGIKETTPHAIVRYDEVDNNRNMASNVDLL